MRILKYLLLLLVLIFFFPSSSFAAYTSDQFTYLATHSYATAQSTSYGKAIATLFPWNGNIYIGYGDYDTNTGPIHITYYDPSLKQIVQPAPSFLADTEAIYNYRVFNNKLYAPAIDPKTNVYNLLYSSGEPWSNSQSTILPTSGSTVDGEHIFDMASLQTPTGTDLWAVGSSYLNNNGVYLGGTTAGVWRSTDSGAHWTRVINDDPMSGTTNVNVDFARYYFAGVLNNKLYLQAVDYETETIHPLRIFDPMTDQWSTSSATILQPTATYTDHLGWRPVEFTTSTKKSLMVLTGNQRIGTSPTRHPTRDNVSQGHIYYFDGTTSRKVSDFQEYDITTYNGYVLAITTDARIMYSSDLENWTQYATAPSTARSIAAMNDVLYIGTSDSKLYSLTLNLPSLTPSISTPSVPLNCPSGFSLCSDIGPHSLTTSQVVITGSDSSSENQKLILYPGVTPHDIHVKISTITDGTLISGLSPVPPPWAQGFNTVSNVFNFEAFYAFNGISFPSFVNPVTVLLSYDPTKLYGRNPATLRIGYYDQVKKRWQVLSPSTTVLDTFNHTIANTTKALSYFTVLYPKSEIALESTNQLVTTKPTITSFPPSAAIQKVEVKNTTPEKQSTTQATAQKKCFLWFCK